MENVLKRSQLALPYVAGRASIGAWIAVFCMLCQTAEAGLIGTQLSLRTLAQATPSSPPFTTSFPNTVTVSATSVEYPDIASLFDPSTGVPPGFARSLVNTAIDVGDNYVEIDFDNSAPFTQFASAFQNTYIFRFDSSAVVRITGAAIDSSVTTLGLDASDVSFIGNELFVNVEGLPFNPSSFARINLVSQADPQPTPLPGSGWLLGVGLLAVGRSALRRMQMQFASDAFSLP